MRETFKKYLDNAHDGDTIYLELQDSYEFEECYAIMEQIDDNDLRLLQRKGVPVMQVETSRQMLFDLIREVWDTAYSYGFRDHEEETTLTIK